MATETTATPIEALARPFEELIHNRHNRKFQKRFDAVMDALFEDAELREKHKSGWYTAGESRNNEGWELTEEFVRLMKTSSRRYHRVNSWVAGYFLKIDTQDYWSLQIEEDTFVAIENELLNRVLG